MSYRNTFAMRSDKDIVAYCACRCIQFMIRLLAEILRFEEETMENEIVSKNFIEQIIDQDIKEGHCKKVVTRFPPEPNGYLHIGHAKSILLNYGLAKEYNGQFNMRFDDTNPTKEKEEFVDSIKRDVEWLGAKWHGDVLFASGYFDQMYEAAVRLIKKGKAYVCDLTPEQIITMDWLLDNVIGKIPELEELEEGCEPIVKAQGIIHHGL